MGRIEAYGIVGAATCKRNHSPTPRVPRLLGRVRQREPSPGNTEAIQPREGDWSCPNPGPQTPATAGRFPTSKGQSAPAAHQR